MLCYDGDKAITYSWKLQVFPQRLPSPTPTFLVRTHQLGFVDFFFPKEELKILYLWIQKHTQVIFTVQFTI